MGLSQWKRKLDVSPMRSWSWSKLSRYLSRVHGGNKARNAKNSRASLNTLIEPMSVLAENEKQETAESSADEPESTETYYSMRIDLSGNFIYLQRAEMAWRWRRYQEAKAKQMQLAMKDILDHGERPTSRQMESGGFIGTSRTTASTQESRWPEICNMPVQSNF